jgi:hypothetical protein
VQLGFNKAGTLKSSSILIYSHSEQSICTQSDRHDAVFIKAVIKIRSESKGVNEMLLIEMRAWKLISKFEVNAKNVLFHWALF